MQSKFILDDKSKLIIARLNELGYEAYAVGGFVRDSLLGLETSDIDICTSARPEEIKQAFAKYEIIDVGSKYGTIIILLDHKPYEVTTFRLDGDYEDGRRPKSVDFTDDLSLDLSRRDFTVNAMAYHPKRGLIDLFDGLADLERRLIRTVGQADVRFSEDYLRMLRAVRFATKYSMDLDEDVLRAIMANSSNISLVSAERINVEFTKIIMSDYPVRGIKMLRETGLLPYIIEDLDRAYGFDQETVHHQYDLFEHTMKVLEEVDKNLELRLAAIFHDLGKLYTKFIGQDGQGHFYGHDKKSEELAQIYLHDLRYDKKTIENVSQLVRRHMDAMNEYTEKSIRRLIRKIGEENTRKLLNLQRADVLATANPQFTANIDKGLSILNFIIEEDKIVYREQLDINGRDLIALGYKEGRELGQVLEYISELVFDEVLDNDKNVILEYILERSYKDEEDNTIRFMFGIK